MFDCLFNTLEPMVDQELFIAQMEEELGTPAAAEPQGSRYELYLLLQRLKAGGMSFEQFLAQAKAWAQEP